MRAAQRGSEMGQETGTYVQLFLYRVPKKNHGVFARVEAELAGIFKKHGITRSEFYELAPARIFKGFTSVAQTMSANPDDEVWLELDFYKDQKDRDEVVARIGQDPAAGPLFGQVLSLCATASNSLEGDFSRSKT